MLANFGTNASGVLFSWRANSSLKVNTLGSLCLWQCFVWPLCVSHTVWLLMVGIVPVLIYSRFNTFLFQGPNSWAKDSRASDIWAQPSAQKKWTGPKCPGLNLPIIPGNNNNISFPFPKVLNGIFHSRSRPQKLGKEFSFPFPKVGNTIFHSRSRSQKLGMGWAIQGGSRCDSMSLTWDLRWRIVQAPDASKGRKCWKQKKTTTFPVWEVKPAQKEQINILSQFNSSPHPTSVNPFVF